MNGDRDFCPLVHFCFYTLLKVWIADTAIAVAAAGLSSDAAAMVRMGLVHMNGEYI